MKTYSGGGKAQGGCPNGLPGKILCHQEDELALGGGRQGGPAPGVTAVGVTEATGLHNHPLQNIFERIISIIVPTATCGFVGKVLLVRSDKQLIRNILIIAFHPLRL